MAEQQAVTVRIAQGQLRGRSRLSDWGFTYFSFQGIPYAAPPVGPLRFKPPQPAAGWTGLRDATREGSIAPQWNLLTGQFDGDEDCLFINVYTPRIPSKDFKDLLPVMIMVHGGGLGLGSGNEDWFGPDFLLPHDVLVVTFNYRLGPLGFLSTGDSVVPGNMGFKDQVMALRWVRDNVSSFGGDPHNVTIFGGSAGGWSCHALVLSPLARGLFRRAIPQSGVAVGDGVCTRRVRDRSFNLAAQLGLQTDDSGKLLEFLRQQPARALVEASMTCGSPEDQERGTMFLFVGTVEPEDAEGGAFLSREPMDILRSGDFEPVPMITGVAAAEGLMFATSVLPTSPLLSNYAKNHRLLIPANLQVPEEEKDSVAEEIRRFYFGNRDICQDTQKELCFLLGDVMFTYPAIRAANCHSSKFTCPVYFYVFEHIREEGIKDTPIARVFQYMKECKVAGHGADLGCIFHCSAMVEAPEPDSVDGRLVSEMNLLWTNFAKTGQPTEGSEADAPVSWPAYSKEQGAYLRVQTKGLSIDRAPFKEVAAFWDALYSRYDS